MATDTQKFKTVATFNEKVQADIVAALLGDNGIPAGVFGADSSYPSLGFAKPMPRPTRPSKTPRQKHLSAARGGIRTPGFLRGGLLPIDAAENHPGFGKQNDGAVRCRFFLRPPHVPL